MSLMGMTKEELLEKAKETIYTLLSNVVPDDQKAALRDWVKLAEMPPATPATPAVETPKELKTKDGKKLSVEGELKEGSVIKEITETGMVDLADGDYILVDDANVELPIKVAGGKITGITAPKDEEIKPEGEMAAQVATLSTQLSEQKTNHEKENTVLKTELADVKAQVVSLSKILDQILKAPVNLSTPKVEKKLEEMSNAEKVRFNRGEKIYK